jgi:hypothetical protein
MQYDDPRLMGVLITGLFGVCQQHIFPTSFNRRKELSFPSKKKLPFAENQAVSEKMEM